MKKLNKLFALVLAVLMLVSCLAACGGSKAPAERTPKAGETGIGATGVGKYGGHMNLRIAATPNGLDPLKQTGTWKYLYTTCVFEPALTRDAENNIVPGVCDFELSEDLLDLKLWVRDGYTFSDEQYGAVDIYDVEASWKRALSLYANIKKYVAPNVASMTVENDGEKDILHVVFSKYHEKNLYYMANYRTWCAVMPKEICEKYAQSYVVDQIEDAIGCGPYKYAYYEDSVKISVVKRDDYIPVEGKNSGFGGTKFGYLDSISFIGGLNDASAAVALLAGDIDMVEVLPKEYMAQAESVGLNSEVLPSDQSTVINFNSKGVTNMCSKYPSLRKAILAAIDYPSFLAVLTDDQAIDLSDEKNQFILHERYNTEAWRKHDFYGPAQADIVAKYIAEAEKEGYKGEPIQLVYSSSRSDIPTMMKKSLEDFDINCKLTTMESTVYNTFISSYSNNWDFYFGWATSAYTPVTLGDSLILNAVPKEEGHEEILEQMSTLDPTSDEYLALWDQLSTLVADKAYLGWMARIEWWWWHPNTLHSNDDGLTRYVYNTYWDDPENHPTPDQF